MNFRKLFYLYIIIISSFNISFLISFFCPHYDGITYAFEDDMLGFSGTQISFVDKDLSDLYCSASILYDNDSSNRYLQLLDNNIAGKASIKNFWNTNHSIKVIEFDISKSDDKQILQFFFYESGVGRIIWLQINKKDLVCREFGTNWTRIKTNYFRNDSVYHIKIELKEDTNEYIIHVNGIREGIFNYDKNSKNGIDSLRIETTGYNDSDYSCYLDNIKYIWFSASTSIISSIILIIELVFLLIMSLILIVHTINKRLTRKIMEDEESKIKTFNNKEKKKYKIHFFLFDLLIYILSISILLIPIVNSDVKNIFSSFSLIEFSENNYSFYSSLRILLMIILGIYSFILGFIIYKRTIPEKKNN